MCKLGKKIIMSRAKQKYYVVWKGVQPGIYHTWTDCMLQIKGYEGAIYKSFDSHEDAVSAYNNSPWSYIGHTAKKNDDPSKNKIKPYITESLAVDAACSGNPGNMEYRGVMLKQDRSFFV